MHFYDTHIHINFCTKCVSLIEIQRTHNPNTKILGVWCTLYHTIFQNNDILRVNFGVCVYRCIPGYVYNFCASTSTHTGNRKHERGFYVYNERMQMEADGRCICGMLLRLHFLSTKHCSLDTTNTRTHMPCKTIMIHLNFTNFQIIDAILLLKLST